MTLEITGKNIDITPAIRERFEFKFNKLEKLQVPLIKKHIMISKEPSKLFKKLKLLLYCWRTTCCFCRA